MAPVDYGENRAWHFKSHSKGTSEAKQNAAVHNKHTYSSKKNHHECLFAFTGYSSFMCQNCTCSKTDHVDGFQEIKKVGGKTSGVITLRKHLKRPSEFLELLSVYVEQDT